jgi:glycosyltransferase involved in cell wall biosynthesis
VEKVRVLEIIQTIGIGGAETVMFNTACFLDKSRFEVYALVVGGGALVDKLKENKISVDTFDYGHSYNWSLLKYIRKIIRQYRIEIVHTHLSRMNTYGFVGSRFTSAKNVMTVHGLTEFSGFPGRMYYTIFGNLSGKIVTVSEILAERFQSATHVNRKKIAVIPNGIDTTRFSQVVDRPEILRRFNIPADSKVILAVGNIREIKGYEFLIESFASIAGENPDLVAVICGGDYAGYKYNLDSLIGNLGISERIYFTDFIPDIEVLYGAADLYALTSISEGFSLTTVEAMASSKAVVSTDCVGPREIIENGADGIIVPERDPERYGQAMLALIRDDNKRQAMGQAARKKVEDRYSIDKSVRAFENLFLTLAKRT